MPRTELHVFDTIRVGTAQVVVPLERLIACVLEAEPSAATWAWFVLPGAWGYGDYAVNVEEGAASQSMPVSLPAFVAELRKGSYFYHVELRAPREDVEISLIDSSFLRFVGPDWIASRCAARYERVTTRPAAAHDGPPRHEE